MTKADYKYLFIGGGICGVVLCAASPMMMIWMFLLKSRLCSITDSMATER